MKRCAITGCPIILTRSRSVFCRTHWRLVPVPMREALTQPARRNRAIEYVQAILEQRQREIDAKRPLPKVGQMPYRDD